MTTITVYKSDSCGACAEVLPAIKALASRKGVSVRVVDVDRCGRRCDNIGYVPYITYKGREVSARQLEKMLT